MDWNSELVTRLVELSLMEDCAFGDVTSQCVIPENLQGVGRVIAREELVFCGGPLIHRIVEASKYKISVKNSQPEGILVPHGSILSVLEGRARDLLAVERTILNFLQRLSGVATNTYHFVAKAHGLTLLDTRKTLPGWRLLEKYAVRTGGAKNHRLNLSDLVLIKNNHIDAHKGDIKRVQSILDNLKPPYLPVEVEVRNKDELSRVLKEMRPNIIMLDNMDNDQITDCVAVIRKHNPAILIEVSGGISPERCKELAAIDSSLFVSAGALTTKARNVDISLSIEAA